MDKWLFLIVVLCFLFCLTYDPKSQTLKSFINPYAAVPKKEHYREKPCCDNVMYMAENSTQCQPRHFYGVQFGTLNYGCPPKIPKTWMGAIL